MHDRRRREEETAVLRASRHSCVCTCVGVHQYFVAKAGLQFEKWLMRKWTLQVKLPIFKIDIFCQAPGVFVCDVMCPCNSEKLLFVELRYCGFLCSWSKPLTVPCAPLANKSLNLGFGFTAQISTKAVTGLWGTPGPYALTDFPIVEILCQNALLK